MGEKFCVLNVIYHYVLYSVLVVAHNLCPNINNLNVRSWQSSTHFKGSEFLSECKLPNRKLHATFDLGRGVYISLLAKGKNAFVDCEENQPKLPEDPTSFGIGARRTASVETLLPHKLMWKNQTCKSWTSSFCTRCFICFPNLYPLSQFFCSTPLLFKKICVLYNEQRKGLQRLCHNPFLYSQATQHLAFISAISTEESGRHRSTGTSFSDSWYCQDKLLPRVCRPSGKLL